MYIRVRAGKCGSKSYLGPWAFMATGPIEQVPRRFVYVYSGKRFHYSTPVCIARGIWRAKSLGRRKAKWSVQSWPKRQRVVTSRLFYRREGKAKQSFSSRKGNGVAPLRRNNLSLSLFGTILDEVKVFVTSSPFIFGRSLLSLRYRLPFATRNRVRIARFRSRRRFKLATLWNVYIYTRKRRKNRVTAAEGRKKEKRKFQKKIIAILIISFQLQLSMPNYQPRRLVISSRWMTITRHKEGGQKSHRAHLDP